SSRRRHTRSYGDWSSDVCSSDLGYTIQGDTGQHQPFAWAGKETYDGAGHVAGVFTASYNGEIVHRTYTGTYTVNPDGTGSTLLKIGRASCRERVWSSGWGVADNK